MKVYVLTEYNIESSEIIDIFVSLEKAQSYRDGKPEDWEAGTHMNKWWERTIVKNGVGTTLNVHLSIGEWEVRQ